MNLTKIKTNFGLHKKQTIDFVKGHKLLLSIITLITVAVVLFGVQTQKLKDFKWV